MKQDNLSRSSLLPTYKRFPISFCQGKGPFLWDANHKKYLDMLAGISVNNLGHRHPRIMQAIKQALRHPLHVSNLFQIKNQEDLAIKINQLAQYDGLSFFCNSGTEANEAAYKWSIAYGKSIHKKKIHILAAENSFHGRTLASLSLTGRKAYREPFTPLLSNVRYFQYNNLPSFEQAINQDTAVVFLELVQGEGGVYPIDEKFLRSVRTLCHTNKALLFIDEIQTGCFRTGTFYAFNRYKNLEVDGFTTAKALANGVSIGAFTLHKRWQHLLKPGQHGSTFGGNPFATAVGNATLSVYQSETFQRHLSQIIPHFQDRLFDLKEKCSLIKEIRHQGMMAALEIESTEDIDIDKTPQPSTKTASQDKTKKNLTALIVDACLQHGLIVGAIDNKIIRLLPPLIMRKQDLNLAFDKFHSVLTALRLENHALKN